MENREERGAKRVRQACQNCRRKKTRCTGERPICSFCARLGQECKYDTNDDYANGGPRADMDELSSRIAMLESQLMQMNNTHGVAFANQKRDYGLASPSTAHEAPAVPVVELLNATNLQPVQAMVLSLSDHDSSTNPGADGVARPGGASHSQDIAADVLQRGRDLPTQLATADVYFERCHNQPYCYFAERSFKRRLIEGAVPLYLIYAIFADAAHFIPDQSSTATSWDLTDVYAKGAWTDILQRSLAGDDALALHLVQSTNILAIVDFTAGRMRQAWIKVGLAVRFSQEMQMQEEPDPTLPSAEREEWRRTFWSVYLLDRLVSCGRNRPMTFRDQDCTLSLPCSEQAFRNGHFEPSYKLQQVLESNNQLPDYKPDYFAQVILVSSCLGRAATYIVQGRGNDKYPPWSHRSEMAEVCTALRLVETYLFPEYLSTSEWVRKKLVTNGVIDQQRAGHFLYSRVLFHLGHVLLNHPFLMHERLRSFDGPTPRSFLREAFSRCQKHADWLASTLDEAKSAGCLIQASFFSYATIVAGGVHCLYLHSEDASLRLRSSNLLQTCFRLLEEAGQVWRHSPRILDTLTDLLGAAKASSWLISTDIDKGHPENATLDRALWWHAVDYSALCDKSRGPSSTSQASPESFELPNTSDVVERKPVIYAEQTTSNVPLTQEAHSTEEAMSLMDDFHDPILSELNLDKEYPDWHALQSVDLLWNFVTDDQVKATANLEDVNSHEELGYTIPV